MIGNTLLISHSIYTRSLNIDFVNQGFLVICEILYPLER